MKKVLFVFVFILMLAGIGGTVYFYMQTNQLKGERETLLAQNAELQNAIDAIGPVTTAYTVKAKVDWHTEIKENLFEPITIPVSSVNDDTVTDLTTIDGQYFKIKVSPGTVITKDMIMPADLEDTVYEQDMTFDFFPLGLEVGDYVDVRLTLPYGETFYIFTHKRIENMVKSNHTVKFYLTEAQQAIWQSVLKDKAQYGSYGISIYLTKYIEPGLQDETTPFYPIRTEMESVVTLNPNIKDKTVCINTALREQIDNMLARVKDDDKSNASSGVSSEASGITSAESTYVEGGSGDATSAMTDGDNVSNIDASGLDVPVDDTTSTDATGADVTDGTGDVINDGIDNINDSVNELQEITSDGSYVTDQEKFEADGATSGTYSNEDTIE